MDAAENPSAANASTSLPLTDDNELAERSDKHAPGESPSSPRDTNETLVDIPEKSVQETRATDQTL